MNPLWFFVGLEVGERLYESRIDIWHAADRTHRRVRAWASGVKGRWDYRTWLDSLPVKEKGVS